MTKNENKFYNSLEQIFTGAKIEGEGGFINLLHIKSEYYKKILIKFKEEINTNIVVNGDFKDEFFNRLYSFFSRYFSESGSVYFVKSKAWQKEYEKVYTDNKDVILFWKTNMLYYVKSDILFRNIDVIIKDNNDNEKAFYFDVSELKSKANNEKKELVFIFNKIENDKNYFKVVYSASGSKTKLDEISKMIEVDLETIEKAIGIFNKQSSVDFFINKNARAFLTEQLDLYLHQILLDTDNQFNQVKLDQFKTIKEFAIKIIDFVSQFEDELVRIWNKPKFVKNSNYVISLDKISDEIKIKIAKSNGLVEQVKEWQMLKMVGEDFDFNKCIKVHEKLPIDTKYFKELELEIIGQFENLDEALDGRLIHSENYQALNTIKNKYNERVQCIYIDPPFNTGSDFAYIDNYQDSSWLSIMKDRLDISKQVLSKHGCLYLHLDYNSDYRGRELLNNIFEKNNFVNSLSWGYRSGGASKKTSLPYKHDTILFYSKNQEFFNYNPIIERQYYEKSFMGCKQDKNGRYYSDTLLRDCFEGMIYDPSREYSFNLRKVLNLANEFLSFENSQKPEGLLHLLETLASNKDNIVMDFFAGSGVTTAVAQKTGRKWIGIEMGEHFNDFYNGTIELKNTPKNRKDLNEKFSVIEFDENTKNINAKVRKIGLLGRMKEVLNCAGRHEPCGITNSVNWQGGGFFKYYELEQYEDTLCNMKYNSSNTIFDIRKPFESYIFATDTKLAGVLENNDSVKIDFSKLYKNIDFAETISNLLGKDIKKITKTGVLLEGDQNEIRTDYENMNDEEKINFIKLLKDLLWWGE